MVWGDRWFSAAYVRDGVFFSSDLAPHYCYPFATFQVPFYPPFSIFPRILVASPFPHPYQFFCVRTVVLEGDKFERTKGWLLLASGLLRSMDKFSSACAWMDGGNHHGNFFLNTIRNNLFKCVWHFWFVDLSGSTGTVIGHGILAFSHHSAVK